MEVLDQNRRVQATNPEDGHAVLLMETSPGNRTFTDYPSVVISLDALARLYEECRIAEKMERDQYTLEQLYDYIDSFHRIELFIFSKEISRYKRISKDELKNLFVDQIKKLGQPTSNGVPKEVNGHTNINRNNNSHDDDDDEDEDEDFVEDWSDD